MKRLEFMGDALVALRAWPVETRRRAGFELDAIQRGAMPSDWKAMPVVGRGVYEVRLHIEGEWRLMYVARFPEAVYVLHAFRKKTQATARRDIDQAKRNYQQLVKQYET